MKNKYFEKYTKLAYLHLIKIIKCNNVKIKVIKQDLTYEEIIDLVKEYYNINELGNPRISKQSISNLKNRKLVLNPLIKNEATESFALFIKSKYVEFNIDLFFTVNDKFTQNKEKEVDLNKSFNNKLKNLYFYFIMIFILGISILFYFYNDSIEDNENNIFIDRGFDLEPTIIEEPENFEEISESKVNSKILNLNQRLSIKPEIFDPIEYEKAHKLSHKPSTDDNYFIDDLGIK
jgi:hypothetical protein